MSLPTDLITVLPEREFFISRVIDAPRELVFSAWTDPKHLAEWWGPKAFTNPVCELDLEPGGTHHLVMRSPEGTDYPMQGVLLEIVKPERLVMTLDVSQHPLEWHRLVTSNGAPAGDNPAGEMIQIVTFEEQGNQTKLSIRTRFQSTAIRDAMQRIGMAEGWSQSLDRLEQWAAFRSDLPLETHPVVVKVQRHFDVSPETVFDAWLDPANVGRWMFATLHGEMQCVEIDPRVGGNFVITEKRGDVLAEHFGRYLMIDRPRRLSFAFWNGPDPARSRVTIEVAPTSHGCLLTLTHEIEAQWADYADRVQNGWGMMLERLDATFYADREIVTRREFDAPRDLVFEAWTSPHHVVKWFGPNGFTTTIHEMDVRPGGAWQFVLHGPDGVDYQNKIVYVEIAKPERLVYSHVSTPQFQMTVTFRELHGETMLTMRMRFDSTSERDHVIKVFGAAEGAKQTLARLDDFLRTTSSN